MKIRLICDHEFCHQDRTTIVKIPKDTVLDAERKGEKAIIKYTNENGKVYDFPVRIKDRIAEVVEE